MVGFTYFVFVFLLLVLCVAVSKKQPSASGTIDKRSLHDTLDRAFFAPLGPLEFVRTYFEKKPLVLSRNERNFNNFFSFDDLDAVLRSMSDDSEDSSNFLITGHGTKWKLIKRMRLSTNEYWTSTFKNETLRYGFVRQAFDRGYSLVLNELQENSAKIRVLAQYVHQLLPPLGYSINVNLYVTPPGHQQVNIWYE